MFSLRTSGKIILSAAVFLGVSCLIGGLQISAWRQYVPPLIIGSTVETDETNLTAVTRKWYESYIDSLKGPDVPYDWRIRDASLTYIMPLDQPGYVEISYTAQPASRSPEVPANLGLTAIDGDYAAQKVLYWEETSDGWTVADAMTAAGYDLMFPDPEEQKEEEIAEKTHHYQMDPEEEETYFVKNETLYITYDGGKTSLEVPKGYDLVCMNPNGIPDEYLEPNSYVVSPEFTGFLGYEGGAAVLLHSEDQGQTWNTCRIASGHKALSFLSRTDDGCYAAFATDRSLGSDYYEAFYSSDFENWQLVSMPEELGGHLTCAYWTKDGTGYFADGTCGYVQNPSPGESQMLLFQDPGDLTAQLGYNPFHEIQRFYEGNGLVYMVMGQGADGDYTVDGQLVQALYSSEDGIHFSFKDIIEDNPIEAG